VPAQNKVETESVTAEASPHSRPAEWTDDNLNHFRDHLFRFTRQLFLDTSHTACGGIAQGMRAEAHFGLGGSPGLRHRDL
jgi:hypothetical protein